MDKSTARELARKFVADCSGPIGPLPVQRVLRSHLQFFAALRHAGSTWDQIAALLRSEGLTSKNGGPVSAAVLRAQYGKESRRSPGCRRDGVQARVKLDADLDEQKLVSKAKHTPSTTGAVDRDGIALRMQRAARLRSTTSDN